MKATRRLLVNIARITIVLGCLSTTSWPTSRKCRSAAWSTRLSSPSRKLGPRLSSSARGPSAQDVSIEPEDVSTTPRRFFAIHSTGNFNNRSHEYKALVTFWSNYVFKGILPSLCVSQAPFYSYLIYVGSFFLVGPRHFVLSALLLIRPCAHMYMWRHTWCWNLFFQVRRDPICWRGKENWCRWHWR